MVSDFFWEAYQRRQAAWSKLKFCRVMATRASSTGWLAICCETIFGPPPMANPVPLPPGPLPKVVLMLPSPPGVTILNLWVVTKASISGTTGRRVFHATQGHAGHIDRGVVFRPQLADEVVHDVGAFFGLQAIEAGKADFRRRDRRLTAMARTMAASGVSIFARASM